MTKILTRSCALAVAVGLSSVGCTAETGTTESLGRTNQALDANSVVYFRSNATGWGVDETTRLSTFAGTTTFARTFSVTQPWMITDADTAIVTVTNQVDGWGTSQQFFGASPSPLVVPNTEPLTLQAPGGDAHFKVKYAVMGVHRVIVNFAQTPPTVEIQSQADACAGVCPAGLVCSLLPQGIPTCSEPTPTGP